MTDTAKKTPPVLIAVAWLIVAVPTAWGVTQSARQAWKLFTAPPPPATKASPPTPV
jgi:hypothetical protein